MAADPRPSVYRSEAAREEALDLYGKALSRFDVPVESRQLETTFGETHLLAAGDPDAPPLVLLHGAGGNATMWAPNAPTLTKHFRLLAPDVVGQPGRSAGVRLGYASDDHARWLDEIFAALGVECAVVGGASLGGWLAIRFALGFPGRVRGLAPMAPASLLKIRGAFMARGLLAALVPSRSVQRRFFRYITSPATPSPPEEAIDDLVARQRTTRFDATPAPPVLSDDELSRLPERTLVLFGRDDPIYDAQEAAGRLKRLAPHVAAEIVPDAGHVLTFEQPALVDAALVRHFASGTAP